MLLEILIPVCLILTIAFIFISYQRECEILSKLPPTYKHTPFLGNNQILTDDRSKAPQRIDEAAKELKTPMITVKHYGMYLVIVCDGKLLQRFLVEKGQYTSGRMKLPRFSWLSKDLSHKQGIIGADGSQWNHHRKLALSSLRGFGYGTSVLEQKIINEAQLTVSTMLEYKQKCVDIFPDLAMFTLNIVTGLYFGYTFEHGDHQFEKLLKIMEEIVKSGIQPDFRHIMPYRWMTTLPGLKDEGFEERVKRFIDLREIISDQMANHKEISGSKSDILSVFLQSKGDDGEEIPKIVHQLIFSDLMVAGSETSSTTMSWAVKVLAFYPEIQQKLYEELKDLNMTSLSLQDITSKQLHYTNAFIHECLRYGCVVPQLVPHRVETEFTIDQYTIPKDAVIMGNLWSIHRDPNLWKFPDHFKPENFLDETTREFVRPDEFMAFGQGPRVCLGEKLARSELFILLATIVVNCVIEKPKDHVWDLTESHGSITRKPESFKVIVHPR